MHYYIDGYNLLFRQARACEDLQAQRNKIIQELSTKIAFIGLNATLVFDAHYQIGEGSRGHLHSIEIVFTPEGETADELIIRRLKTASNPRLETVITSDKKLAWRARRKMAHSETVEEFMSWLNRRHKNKERLLAQKKKGVPGPKVIAAPPALPIEEKAHPEGSFEYYQNIFEENYRQQQQATPTNKAPQKVKKGRKIKKNVPAQQETDMRSDMARWLDIFENRTFPPT